MRADLVLQVLILLKDFPLFGFQLGLLDRKVVYLLSYWMNKGLEVLLNFWHGFSNSLHIVTLMLSMDDTLCADWMSVASEAKVWDKLIRMASARNPAAWDHGRGKRWCSTILRALSGSHVELIFVLEWWWRPQLVQSAGVWNLALNIQISLAIIRHLPKISALISLKTSIVLMSMRWHRPIRTKIVSLRLSWYSI